MREIISGIFLLAFLVGCGDSYTIKSIIKDKLNDPDSAKFKELVVSRNGEIACISWNAKNQAGGYGEWKYTLFSKGNDSSWEIREDEEVNSDICTKEGIEVKWLVIVAGNNAYREAISLLEKNGKNYSTCRRLIEEYGKMVEYITNRDHIIKQIQERSKTSNPIDSKLTEEMNDYFAKRKALLEKEIQDGRC